MGNPFPDQEKEIEERGIEELKALSEEAKGVLNHHLRNSLNTIKGNAELLLLKSSGIKIIKLDGVMFEESIDAIIEASDHILEDFKIFGLENK